MKSIVAIVLLWSGSAAAQYVVGVEQCPPGTPPAKPAQGEVTVDLCFGTTVVRLTDAATESTNERVTLMYAKFSPENSDGTRALLRGSHEAGGYPYSSKWMLYNVDTGDPNCYSFIKEIRLHEDENYEPRWSGTEPNVFYYTMNMEFRRYDIVDDLHPDLTNDVDTVIRDFSTDFPSREKIYMDDEGDSSADSRYWAWTTAQWETDQYEKKEAFTYDAQADAILGVLSESDFRTRHGGANWISVTDLGTRVVIGSAYGTWTSSAYDLDFSDGVSLDVWPQHSDTGVDVDGNEVLFGYDLTGDGWGMVDLATGTKTRLLRRPWPDPGDWTGASFGHATGTHSATKPGWGLFSAYGSDCSVGNKFDCTLVFMMQLEDVGHDADSSRIPTVWQIAHSYSSGCYAAQPNATINRSGTRIYFTSRWDYQSGDCPAGTVYDTYVIELPDTWYEDLSGFTITTISLPEAVVGESYSEVVRAVGGTAPYAWSVSDGALADGLALDAVTGVIAGTPTAVGDASFTVRASDSSSPVETAERQLAIAVAAAEADSSRDADGCGCRSSGNLCLAALAFIAALGRRRLG